MEPDDNERPALQEVASWRSHPAAVSDPGHVVGQSLKKKSLRSAQWSPDGTCILTNGGDRQGTLGTFVLPPDLLTSDVPHALSPYASILTAGSIQATAAYPFFNLSDPSTTLLLSSSVDHPIHLWNALVHSSPVASYPCIHPNTEAFISPSALAFTRAGTHFVASSNSVITVFDISRQGDGPLEWHRTIPSRKAVKITGETGIRGILSTMSISNDSLLAVGSFNRMVGIYANEGRGDCETFFHLGRSETAGADGTGITQVEWSPCGRYLYVAERNSDAIVLYDIRGIGKRLATLRGRKADTSQRLAFSIFPLNGGAGHEIWAGGTDGKARVWKNAHQQEGEVDAGWDFQAHTDPVVASIVHPSGTVVATCASPNRSPKSIEALLADPYSRGISDDSFQSCKEGNMASVESTLKVWSLA